MTSIASKLTSIGPQGQAAFASVAQAVSLMDVPLRQTNKTLTNMLTTLKREVSLLEAFIDCKWNKEK